MKKLQKKLIDKVAYERDRYKYALEMIAEDMPGIVSATAVLHPLAEYYRLVARKALESIDAKQS